MPFWPPCFKSKANLSKTFRPGNRDGVFIRKKNFSPVADISVEKIKISATEPSRPLIWTSRNFYKKLLVVYQDLGN